MRKRFFKTLAMSIFLNPSIGFLFTSGLTVGIKVAGIYLAVFWITYLFLIFGTPIWPINAITFYLVFPVTYFSIVVLAALSSKKPFPILPTKRLYRIGLYILFYVILNAPPIILSLTYTLRAFKIPTGAMENTILVGDYIVGVKTFKAHRGDVMIFGSSGEFVGKPPV